MQRPTTIHVSTLHPMSWFQLERVAFRHFYNIPVNKRSDELPIYFSHQAMCWSRPYVVLYNYVKAENEILM